MLSSQPSQPSTIVTTDEAEGDASNEASSKSGSNFTWRSASRETHNVLRSEHLVAAFTRYHDSDPSVQTLIGSPSYSGRGCSSRHIRSSEPSEPSTIVTTDEADGDASNEASEKASEEASSQCC